MKGMLFRIGSLLALVFISLYHSFLSNDPINIVIITLTIVLLSYFLVPLVKQPMINYLVIVSVFFVSAYFNLNLEYSLILLAFFIIDGTYNLKIRDFYIFIVYLITGCLLLSFFSLIPFNNVLIMILLAICASLFQQSVNSIQEKNKLYEQLLVQYRQLKRQSVEQEELVRAEERTKIARDMHDSVGHKITALLMHLEMMDIKNENTTIQTVKQLARESLEETRFAVRQLKVSEASGIQSVVQLIRKLEMESHLMIKFTLEKGILSIPLSNNQSIILYRVLQESLTNAMKHSDSKEVEVKLAINSLQHVQFSVKNKVITHLPMIQGFGLTNMKERLQEIGGELRVNKTEHQFIVEGTFPLRRDVE